MLWLHNGSKACSTNVVVVGTWQLYVVACADALSPTATGGGSSGTRVVVALAAVVYSSAWDTIAATP